MTMGISRRTVAALVSCTVLVAATGCGDRAAGRAACEQGTQVCLDHGEVVVGTGARSAAPEPPCPPPVGGNAAISWVPFVVLDGQMYVTGYDSPEQVLQEDQVGDVVATVSCRIADVGDPDFVPRDGDAAYLPVGTQIHQVQGRPPGEAVAAYEEGSWRLFEATST